MPYQIKGDYIHLTCDTCKKIKQDIAFPKFALELTKTNFGYKDLAEDEGWAFVDIKESHCPACVKEKGLKYQSRKYWNEFYEQTGS